MNRLIYRFYRAMAFVGIGVLTLIAVLSVVSIIGRSMTSIGLGPVRGDFELVEMGAALAIFCFMPWTQLRRAHAAVDLFWGLTPKALKPPLTVFSDVLMLGLWVILVWRMGVAMGDYHATGETTLVLLLPVWWGYAVSMVPAVLGLIAYAWKLGESLGWLHAPTEYAAPAEAGH
jgi:hypothetical protein